MAGDYKECVESAGGGGNERRSGLEGRQVWDPACSTESRLEKKEEDGLVGQVAGRQSLGGPGGRG